MKVREHHREPLRRDLMTGLILLALIMVTIAFRLISQPLESSVVILSFIGLLLFICPYILAINPMLIKTIRENLAADRRQIWLLPIGLYLLSLVYLALAGLLTVKLFAGATFYCFLPMGLVILARKKSSQVNWLDGVAVLALWLPIEFGLLSSATIPPRHSILNLYHIVGLVLMLYGYLILRDLPPLGLTFRVKFKEVQLAIQNCIIFFIPALLLGLPTGFIQVSHRVPGFTEMAATFLAIGFFIALPEEILFRAIIQNGLEQRWQNQSQGIIKALLVTSILFGLAHANNHNPPFIDIDFGSLGVWHFPWVYVVLATLAGVAYGWTFIKTRKVTAAALVHLLVDWVWSIFFNG